jgi:hypothetical protein
MLITPGRPKGRSRLAASPRHVIVPLLLAAFAQVALAQDCPVTTDVATYPSTPLTYPMTSDRYAVQYQLGGSGTWTNAKVYITYYGGTMASPYIKASRYAADTSMSFASIPANSSTSVALRVTKLFGSAFPAIDQMSVRPLAKGIHVDSVSGSTVQLSTNTAANFAGDQFILWWDGDSEQSSAIQGLAFFLNPPYDRPTGPSVKTITAPSDLTGDLSSFDTLDFEGTVAVASTGTLAFIVPANINNIFLAPGAWLQGKLRFTQSGAGHARRVYGPGVLDASRFGYMWRQCRNSTVHTDDGYQSLSWIPLPAGTTGSPSIPDSFFFDGIVITDSEYYATASLTNATVNNVKLIGWNGNNDGFQFGVVARASNVFVRTGDDSLKMWGSHITITNATVWQNWNGGVVNLGWSDNSPGEDCLIDGLYVVKTDWHAPDTPSWNATTLNGQNNAIVASLMVPGTKFGASLTSVYRNIYVEDPPHVLVSLKILPPDCALVGLKTCPTVDLSQPSVLNVNLENVFTPASIVENSIGFQTVNGSTLTGTMNIGLTNVMLTMPDGTVTPLTSANAAAAGKIGTNGDGINLDFSHASPDFTLDLDQPAVTAKAGSKVTTSVAIGRIDGFAGNVTVAPPNESPRGIKAPVDSVQTTGSSASFRIKIKGSAQPGAYPLTFTGTDASGRTRTATLTLTVQ